MISDRLYHPNTCMAQDPETGRMEESIELAQCGSAMAEKAKSLGWKGSRLCFRDTLMAASQNSSDPDDLGPMGEFSNLKAELHIPRQDGKKLRHAIKNCET